MRRINPPGLATDDAQVCTFAAFVLAVLTIDKRFNVDARGCFAGERIARRLKSYESGSLDLETEDAKLLKEACEAPTDGYPIRPAHAAAGFVRAVVEQFEVE